MFDKPFSTSNLSEFIRTLMFNLAYYSNVNLSFLEFLKQTSSKLIEFYKCDALDIFINNESNYYVLEIERFENMKYSYKKLQSLDPDNPGRKIQYPIETIISIVKEISSNFLKPNVSDNGNYWIPDTEKEIEFVYNGEKRKIKLPDKFKSIAVISYFMPSKYSGKIIYKSKNKDYFSSENMPILEELTQLFGFVIANKLIHNDYQERIKELTCLIQIAQIEKQADMNLDEIMQEIVDLLPLALHYPDIASAQIELNNKKYYAKNYCESSVKLSSEIKSSSQRLGKIELIYTEKRDDFLNGVFLKEEVQLIETIAKQISSLTERIHSKSQQNKLEEQLRHADRLASIGQLSAGVAHELNEPLANILGFAQLIRKENESSENLTKDLDKIIRNCLHGREVVKKLLLFSRQIPTKKSKINFNHVIEEALYFLEARCEKEGIELIKTLGNNIPEIIVDAGQLNQILVNLVVNSIQAMPEGGKIEIITKQTDDFVHLIVVDNGHGMTEDVRKQAFLPFFTTKDIGQGTGLGLPVVHGIVTSHKGFINLQSEVGKGTRVEIILPIYQQQNF